MPLPSWYSQTPFYPTPQEREMIYDPVVSTISFLKRRVIAFLWGKLKNETHVKVKNAD